MTTKRSQMLDHYSDFLIVSFGLATATTMANLMEGISHDQITRFLNAELFTDKDLWKIVKPHLRRIESEEGVLIFDDTIQEKPYTDKSELMAYHFDHTVGRIVKGINLMTALYVNNGISLPIALHFIQKTKPAIDPKTKKEILISPISKNEILQNMVSSAVQKQVKFRYVLADSWFSSADNMVYIKNKCKKEFIIPLKDNRNIYLGDPSEKKGKPVKLDSLNFVTYPIQKVWLENVPFPVLVSRQVFPHENGTEGILYLCTSDLELSFSSLATLYQKRWKVEEYHKSIKSNVSFSKSPTKRTVSQLNHFFCSVVGFIKLEVCRCSTGLNHFAQKFKLYEAALASAYEQLRLLKGAVPEATINPTA
jgi:hypothetical protein